MYTLAAFETYCWTRQQFYTKPSTEIDFNDDPRPCAVNTSIRYLGKVHGAPSKTFVAVRCEVIRLWFGPHIENQYDRNRQVQDFSEGRTYTWKLNQNIIMWHLLKSYRRDNGIYHRAHDGKVLRVYKFRFRQIRDEKRRASKSYVLFFCTYLNSKFCECNWAPVQVQNKVHFRIRRAWKIIKKEHKVNRF